MKESARLRLLHVASSHMMGLTNQETQLALAYQALNDVDITVVSGENEQVAGCFDALRRAGIPYATINGLDQHHQFIRLVREFGALVAEIKSDIVSVNTNWQLVIAAAAKIFGRSPYKIVYTIHGFRHNHPVKSVIARGLIGALLLLFSDRINAPTGYVRNKFAWLKYKIKSIPLGEDDLFFINSRPPDFTRPLSFCFAGQFREGKNQAMLIEAFAEYIAQTNDQAARLVLPGNGDLLPACKSVASRLGIAGQVVFPGQLNRQEMVEIYKKCQVALVPTNSETFGHCIAEPLVMRRIVLSRPVGIANDVIIHGTNGFIFNTKPQLIDLMVGLKQMEEVDLKKIAESAGVVGLRFSWKEIAKSNVAILMAPLLS